MSNQFFEKGLERLEQGGNAVKQQVKTNIQSASTQVTGQQPSPQGQGDQGGQLHGVKEQLLGVPTPPQTIGAREQILGNHEQSPQQADAAQAEKRAQDEKFKNELYGVSDDPAKIAEMQQTLDPSTMAAKKQAEQQQTQSVQDLLKRYFNPEIEDKMQQLRTQRVQEKKQEEQMEERVAEKRRRKKEDSGNTKNSRK